MTEESLAGFSVEFILECLKAKDKAALVQKLGEVAESTPVVTNFQFFEEDFAMGLNRSNAISLIYLDYFSILGLKFFIEIVGVFKTLKSFFFFFLGTLSLYFYIFLFNLGSFLLLTLIIASITLLERKLLSLVQRRVGPNYVGFKGRLQFIADALKFLLKQIILINQLNRLLFLAIPMLVLVLSYLF